MSLELELEMAANVLGRPDVTIIGSGRLVLLVTNQDAPNPIDGASEAFGAVFVFTRCGDQWVNR
jgi:hypothetical protein